jgi:ferric-dicitrate binding protein FerR (iron transport regulator)
MGQGLTEEESRELNSLLEEHPGYHFFREIIGSVRGERVHQEPATEEEDMVSEGWALLKRGLDDPHAYAGREEKGPETGRRMIYRWLRVAAILGAVMLLGGVIFYRLTMPEDHHGGAVARTDKQVAVPAGMPQKITLPDGSEVWLNAGSRLRYANAFIQKERDVFLDGEAYFKIKHDGAHPFVVHAGNVLIRVLGTEFNVQAYDDDNHIEATLISGKVQVQIIGKPDNKIVLAPHEKLTVINQGQKVSCSKEPKPKKEVSFKVQEVVPLHTTPIPEVAWLQDKFAFKDEAFDELAKKLGRRYGVHFLFRDTSLEDEKLSGVFENETIEKAVRLLQMTTPFHYTIAGDTVYLSR